MMAIACPCATVAGVTVMDGFPVTACNIIVSVPSAETVSVVDGDATSPIEIPTVPCGALGGGPAAQWSKTATPDDVFHAVIV